MHRIAMIAHRFAKSARLCVLLGVCTAMAACASSPQPDVPERAASERHPPERKTPRQPPLGDRAAAIAVNQVGVPYRYGGNAPSSGFDCSGLVHYAYLRAGKVVPRTTGALWDSATPVSSGQVRRGDVLFFRFDGKMSHVGLYLGNGRFVHAPSSGRVVSIEDLGAAYYQRALVRAGRL